MQTGPRRIVVQQARLPGGSSNSRSGAPARTSSAERRPPAREALKALFQRYCAVNEQYRAADAQFRSALEGRARPGSALMPVDQWCERDARGYAKAVRDINRYQEQVNSVLRELHAAFGIVGSGLADLDVLRRKGVREPSREFHARFLALQDAKKGLYGIRDPEARGAAAALKAFATAAIALRAEMDRLLARARSADAR